MSALVKLAFPIVPSTPPSVPTVLTGIPFVKAGDTILQAFYTAGYADYTSYFSPVCPGDGEIVVLPTFPGGGPSGAQILLVLQPK